WMFGQQVAPKFVWILAGGCSEFIHECFDDKSLHRRTDGAPETIWNFGIRFDVFNSDVWNVVWQRRRAVDGNENQPVGGQPADTLHQRLLYDALHEDRWLAGGIDCAPHASVGDGPVIVMLHVILARPDDLHRFPDCFRGLHGIG